MAVLLLLGKWSVLFVQPSNLKSTLHPSFISPQNTSLRCATLISNCSEIHTMVLRNWIERLLTLTLSFKLSKCVSYLFDGTRQSENSIQLMAVALGRVPSL